MKIKLNELDLGYQTRQGMNDEVVKEYAEAMQNGTVFPPITVVGNMLVDGYHRVEAMKSLGIEETEAIVTEGDRALALSAALKVNANHGLRRTNADKRHALEIAWQNRDILFKESRGENGLPSVRELAQMCAVSIFLAHEFITYNKVLENNTPSDESCGCSQNVAAEGRGVGIFEQSQNCVSSKTTCVSQKTDRFGTPIPEKLLSVFTAELPREAARHLRKASKIIKRAYKMADVNFPAADQRAVAFLTNLEEHLKRHAAHCVCRACLGKGCDTCHKLGFITPAIYNRLPPELKAVKK